MKNSRKKAWDKIIINIPKDLLTEFDYAIQTRHYSRSEAIKEARESEFELNDAILDHLGNKLSLAEYIGLDNLPGDTFKNAYKSCWNT